MSQFLGHPHIPEARVTLCALASGYPFLEERLSKIGVKVIAVQPCLQLAPPIQRHSDLRLFLLPNGEVLIAPEFDCLAFSLKKEKFDVKSIRFTLNSPYPNDIPICCFALGQTLYCHPHHTAPELMQSFPRLQPVRQGYARCAVCIVNDNSLITADNGIARAAEANGVDVLRVRPGFISLPGYDYGFLGGCCGLLSPTLLAFTGDIFTHPDSERIHAFCRERGVDILSLADGPLLDIGGILPLKQDG